MAKKWMELCLCSFHVFLSWWMAHQSIYSGTHEPVIRKNLSLFVTMINDKVVDMFEMVWLAAQFLKEPLGPITSLPSKTWKPPPSNFSNLILMRHTSLLMGILHWWDLWRPPNQIAVYTGQKSADSPLEADVTTLIEGFRLQKKFLAHSHYIERVCFLLIDIVQNNGNLSWISCTNGKRSRSSSNLHTGKSTYAAVQHTMLYVCLAIYYYQLWWYLQIVWLVM